MCTGELNFGVFLVSLIMLFVYAEDRFLYFTRLIWELMNVA